MNDNADLPVAVDAFCGAGGLSLGLSRAGFRVAAAFDANAKAVATYNRNFTHRAFVADVCDVSAADLFRAGVEEAKVTLVAGGPPCQGFSVQRRRGEAADDSRNSLPMEFLRLICELSPPFFLFENVPGIKRGHGEKILKSFLVSAREAGYVCHAETLDAVNFGVPQFRRRLFIVGELSKNGDAWFTFPKPFTDCESPETHVGRAFAGLPEPPMDFAEHPSFAHHKRTRLSALNLRRLSMVPQGGGMQDLPEEMRVQAHRNGAGKIGHRFVYGRLHWHHPAATITGKFDSFTRGKFGHPLQDRNITLREGARLQTFPDDFTFDGGQEEIALQIGNAVPPLLAQALAESIRSAWERKRRSEKPLKRGEPCLIH